MSDELKASVTTKAFPELLPPGYLGPSGSEEPTASDEVHAWKAAAYDAQQQSGFKCRVLSISQRYITLETDQLHNLQQGQSITIHAD